MRIDFNEFIIFKLLVVKYLNIWASLLKANYEYLIFVILTHSNLTNS